MGATKPYEFIRCGAMEATKPYEFIRFGAICLGEVSRPGRGFRGPRGRPDPQDDRLPILKKLKIQFLKIAFCDLSGPDLGIGGLRQAGVSGAPGAAQTPKWQIADP